MIEGMIYDAAGVITCGRVGFTETFRNVFQCAPPLKYGVRMTNSPYWDQSLTNAVKSALQSPAKYVLFFDGDGTWEPKDVFDLYQLIESDPRCDAVFPVQADRFGQTPLVFNWLPDIFGPYNFDTPTTKYPHGHFGLTLIRREVFEQMPEPWFHSQPANDGTWDMKPGKLDADTYFWLKLKQDIHSRTGHYCLQANYTVIGHMELMIRWQRGAEVVCQTIPDYQRLGKPYGCRYPRVDEYPKPETTKPAEPEATPLAKPVLSVTPEAP